MEDVQIVRVENEDEFYCLCQEMGLAIAIMTKDIPSDRGRGFETLAVEIINLGRDYKKWDEFDYWAVRMRAIQKCMEKCSDLEFAFQCVEYFFTVLIAAEERGCITILDE